MRLTLSNVGASAGGGVSLEIESIFHARKSAHYMTVEVTVDGNASEQDARFHAGLQVQEIIEWE